MNNLLDVPLIHFIITLLSLIVARMSCCVQSLVSLFEILPLQEFLLYLYGKLWQFQLNILTKDNLYVCMSKYKKIY